MPWTFLSNMEKRPLLPDVFSHFWRLLARLVPTNTESRMEREDAYVDIQLYEKLHVLSRLV